MQCNKGQVTEIIAEYEIVVGDDVYIVPNVTLERSYTGKYNVLPGRENMRIIGAVMLAIIADTRPMSNAQFEFVSDTLGKSYRDWKRILRANGAGDAITVSLFRRLQHCKYLPEYLGTKIRSVLPVLCTDGPFPLSAYMEGNVAAKLKTTTTETERMK